jgi:hypothetical protein
MFRSLIVASLFTIGAPALATPHAADTARAEMLGAWCEDGLQVACRALVTETNGNCAGPVGSGCRYDSRTFVPVNPQEPMVLVPGLESLGWSRISTVEHCQELTGSRDWTELMTDAEFEGMALCLQEHT